MLDAEFLIRLAGEANGVLMDEARVSFHRTAVNQFNDQLAAGALAHVSLDTPPTYATFLAKHARVSSET